MTSTVIVVPFDGINLSVKSKEVDEIHAKVEKRVRAIIDELKKSHTKFEDADFGVSETDEYGEIGLYGDMSKTPDPAGSKYPEPSKLVWERPQYNDDESPNTPSEEGKEKKGDDDDSDEDSEDDDSEDEDSDDEFGGYGGYGGYGDGEGAEVVKGR